MLWKSKPHIFLILISLDSKGIRSRRRDDWSHTLGPFVSLAALQRISTWFEIVTWFEMCGCIKINWKPKLRGLLLVSSRSFGPYRPIDSIKIKFTPGFLLEYHWKSTNITNVNTTTYHYMNTKNTMNYIHSWPSYLCERIFLPRWFVGKSKNPLRA